MNAHPIDTEALRKLTDAATSGPWVVEYDNEDDYEQGIAYGPFPTSLHGPESLTKWDDPRWQAEYGYRVSEISDMRQADAEFIAAARGAVPALLDALAAAEHRATRAEAERDEWRQTALDERGAALDALEQIKVRDARAADIWDEGWEQGMAYVTGMERGTGDDHAITNPYKASEGA